MQPYVFSPATRPISNHTGSERVISPAYPEEDSIVCADIYTWRATDEQALCAYWIGKQAEAFTLNRRLLARPDRIADNSTSACRP